MLNISKNSINKDISLEDFKSNSLLQKSNIKRIYLWLISGFLLILFFSMFLPWTQNINAKGAITTRSPEQRPQSIQSIIAGRIENWYIKEGDFVNKGDTVVFLSEVKSEYLDPNLIERTTEQVNAKAQSVNAYDDKIIALQNQYNAIEQGLSFKRAQNKNKIIQAKNKITIDSIGLVAQQTNYEIAKNQYSRINDLYKKGLKSLSELQQKELKLQETSAKVTVQENKLLNQQNELTNTVIELSSIEREYADKMAKSQSEKQSALSARLETLAATSKLQNQLSNYSARQEMYFITAPQSGYITKILKKGIGETVKESSIIATIMPDVYDLAVEIYLKPQDLPLVSIGSNVRLRFDGWPAIVISGWPEGSTGIFSGNVIAIERFIGDNGYYRILISPDQKKKKWPEEIRVGTGASAFLLLNNVPIWYEIWRQLNGFPADFYKKDGLKKEGVKTKAPIKSIK
jgi:adhesin transport system membrane fusion protein